MVNILNEPVLLLNMTYEPIGLISTSRAICLKFKDKVYFEEVTDKEIRSLTDYWKAPSVVRLKHFINITARKIESSKKRNRIYIRDRYKCSYCSTKCNMKNITLDHVIPRAQNGQNTPENLVTCCIDCNRKKGNRTPEQAGMTLKHTPTKLKVGLDKHVLFHYGEMNPSWKKYLYHAEDSMGDMRYTHRES